MKCVCTEVYMYVKETVRCGFGVCVDVCVCNGSGEGSALLQLIYSYSGQTHSLHIFTCSTETDTHSSTHTGLHTHTHTHAATSGTIWRVIISLLSTSILDEVICVCVCVIATLLQLKVSEKLLFIKYFYFNSKEF